LGSRGSYHGMPMAAPRIKFCGNTSVEDAELAVELGAWAVGLIFYEPSPRYCDPAVAGAIAARLRRRAEVVGVWVNGHLDEVSETASDLGLTMIQLHGDEGPAYCAEVARRTGCRVIKAVPVASAGDLQALGVYHTDFHLLDTGHAHLRGGTGETWDWRMAAAGRLRTEVPRILSGGLRADNVSEAIEIVRPYAVDVVSGVEAAPGVKDAEKMAAFAEAVRATAEVSAA
jgi:phosphoribosylanthranilate isomerase